MDSIHDDRLRWLFRAAAFLHESGAEPVSGLVLPNGRDFPDAFDGSPAGVDRLMQRVLDHAGLHDVHVEVQIVLPDGDVASGCKTGGCSAPVLKALQQRRVVPLDSRDGYAVAVSSGEVGHATALTTALVRAVSTIFLAEAELEDELEPTEREAFVDVAGSLLGFGVLLANGAHMTHKGCSGVTVQKATVLPVEELVCLLALGCKVNGLSVREARAELDAEPRRLLEPIAAWIDANDEAVGWVKSNRLALDADRYRFNEPGGLFARLFRGRTKTAVLPTDDELLAGDAGFVVPREVSEKARRMAALRNLVDETLD